MTSDPADERILRAKYLDWCSARVADRFLELTPEQIYDLAHVPSWRDPASAVGAAPRSVGVAPGVPPAPGAAPSATGSEPTAPGGGEPDGRLNYQVLVARVTEVLAARLGLPSFEEWAAAYRKRPEQYEEELLGFWQREV